MTADLAALTSRALPPLPPGPTAVLMVCLGNICRSPLARLLVQHTVTQRGLQGRISIDSCGTGPWHVGKPADPRSVAAARRHGLSLTHRARQLDAAGDFARFPVLIAMDADNARTLTSRGADPERIRLLRAFDPALADVHDHQTLAVPDPYHEADDAFDEVFARIRAAGDGLVDAILAAQESV
ncbi:MAG: low molecular weight phosphotyrosine protein phosphatase [Phycisphaerales bacterium]|nr:low molecular weight phosphotyrosine protein phosphatase [Phycisphaerales bacterium]